MMVCMDKVERIIDIVCRSYGYDMVYGLDNVYDGSYRGFMYTNVGTIVHYLRYPMSMAEFGMDSDNRCVQLGLYRLPYGTDVYEKAGSVMAYISYVCSSAYVRRWYMGACHGIDDSDYKRTNFIRRHWGLMYNGELVVDKRYRVVMI